MSKPPKLSLASIVAQAHGTGKPTKAEPQRSAEIVRLARAAAPTAPAATLKQRARQMSVYLEPAVHEQLREMAFTERTKMHALMLEALDLLFRQRGARSIEQLARTEGR